MDRRWWLLLGALAVVAVVLGGAWLTRERSVATPSGSPVAGVSPGPSAISSVAPVGSATAAAPPQETPSPSSGLSAEPATTPPPRSSGPPRLAYAAFLLRVNDDRSRVETLNAAVTTAAQAQDPGAVRTAAVDILDFVDTERDWLRDNPPAECYAEAHASADAMLVAYGAAADAFIAWAETGGGLAGLGAVGTALEAADVAGDALTEFGRVLEGTRCPA
jgi:hypothetical protein